MKTLSRSAIASGAINAPYASLGPRPIRGALEQRLS
jgi:hypothetical protein